MSGRKLVNRMSDDRSWRRQAACGELDPRVFTEKTREAEAKRVCNELCPVRQRCLDCAIRNKEEGAVWGGLNDDERLQYAKRSRRRAG